MKISNFKAKEVSDYFFGLSEKKNKKCKENEQREIAAFDKMTRGKYENK